jgi:hypothetical protein
MTSRAIAAAAIIRFMFAPSALRSRKITSSDYGATEVPVLDKRLPLANG